MRFTLALLVLGVLTSTSGCGMMEEGPMHHSGHHPGPVSQNTERYEHYGTNPIIDTADDNLVTFGIDVDTGSYTLMRRDVSAGRLPAPGGVRVEEFVNFFDYGDSAPSQDEAPIRIHTETGPSPFGSGKQLMRVALKGYELAEEERPPANLVFLVDVSGSMQSDDKIGLVRYALTRLTQTLRDDDQVAIVSYAGADRVILQPTPISQRSRILNALDLLETGGGTNGAAGILTAYDLAEAAQAEHPGAVNRVILCSDGDFNVGVRGDALLNLIETNRDRGISLSVFGFGWGNYNDRDMEQMANRGNGNYAFIDREVEAERVLVQNIAGTLVTIAKDAKIQVELNPSAVQSYRLLGYENRAIEDENFRNDETDSGELGVGHAVTAFIEFELTDSDDPAVIEDLGKVVVRYKSPEDDTVAKELVASIAHSDGHTELGETSRAFRLGAAAAELAEILRGSDHVEDADFETIQALARGAIDPMDQDQSDFIELIDRIATLWSTRP